MNIILEECLCVFDYKVRFIKGLETEHNLIQFSGNGIDNTDKKTPFTSSAIILVSIAHGIFVDMDSRGYYIANRGDEFQSTAMFVLANQNPNVKVTIDITTISNRYIHFKCVTTLEMIPAEIFAVIISYLRPEDISHMMILNKSICRISRDITMADHMFDMKKLMIALIANNRVEALKFIMSKHNHSLDILEKLSDGVMIAASLRYEVANDIATEIVVASVIKLASKKKTNIARAYSSPLAFLNYKRVLYWLQMFAHLGAVEQIWNIVHAFYDTLDDMKNAFENISECVYATRSINEIDTIRHHNILVNNSKIYLSGMLNTFANKYDMRKSKENSWLTRDVIQQVKAFECIKLVPTYRTSGKPPTRLTPAGSKILFEKIKDVIESVTTSNQPLVGNIFESLLLASVGSTSCFKETEKLIEYLIGQPQFIELHNFINVYKSRDDLFATITRTLIDKKNSTELCFIDMSNGNPCVSNGNPHISNGLLNKSAYKGLRDVQSEKSIIGFDKRIINIIKHVLHQPYDKFPYTWAIIRSVYNLMYISDWANQVYSTGVASGKIVKDTKTSQAIESLRIKCRSVQFKKQDVVVDVESNDDNNESDDDDNDNESDVDYTSDKYTIEWIKVSQNVVDLLKNISNIVNS